MYPVWHSLNQEFKETAIQTQYYFFSLKTKLRLQLVSQGRVAPVDELTFNASPFFCPTLIFLLL